MTGAELVALALQHVGEPYVLGITVPKDNPDWSGPWDCAEFCSWLVFQAIGRLFGCAFNDVNPATANAYTGYWAQDAHEDKASISIERAARTAGAFVLRIPQAARMGHVVLSDGMGGTVEAKSTAEGVVRDTLSGRRWDCGVLVPGIDVLEGPIVEVHGPAGRVYRVGDPAEPNAMVLAIQERLAAIGINPGPLDGLYGPHTAAAVAAFQHRAGLVADAEAGPKTIFALRLGGHP